jgi:hypothetical protein
MFAMLRLVLFEDLQAAGGKGGGCYILSTTMSGRNFQLQQPCTKHLSWSISQCNVLCCASQISKLLGAKVVAVTSGADKAAYLKQLGADTVVDTAAPAAAGERLHKLIAAAAPKGGYASLVLYHKRSAAANAVQCLQEGAE